MKSSLKTLERKILRKIYGPPIKDQNGWRIRTNEELQVIHKQPNIVTTIKVIRLQWAGHVVRMSDGRTVNKVFLKFAVFWSIGRRNTPEDRRFNQHRGASLKSRKVFLGKPDVRRKAGRPKLRWLDCIENDLKSMDVNRWRKNAEDRSVWAVILK